MSRIIIRNLPEKITKEKLTHVFSEKGIITDVQLKFTKSGKFRKFAFIGYKLPEQAEAAVKGLNKTFINASQIQVEICTGLSDSNKPRPWSKHSQTLKIEVPPEETVEEPPEKKKKSKKIKDPKIEEFLKEHHDDPMFKEYIETHVPEQESLWPDIDKVESSKTAEQDISDGQYFKSKISQQLTADDEPQPKKSAKTKDVNLIKLFTIKLIGLPYKVKKSEIKKFLNPVKPHSIRIPVKVKGIAFCGFKLEQDVKKALVKNRSFLNGKRILVVKYESKQDHIEENEKWKQQEDKIKNEEGIAESGRIFIRNLSYTVTEAAITELFEKYGPVAEVILPIDEFSRKLKGFGIVTFVMPEHACKAFSELDGTVLEGRMLHLLPGLPCKAPAEEILDGTFKQKKQMKQKMAANDSVNWNTFFLGENALAATMAATYNTTKDQVLDDTKSGAAVRLALGETQIVNETKDFLEENGVSLEAFNNMAKCVRSKTIILVKNLPPKTTQEEIREKFAAMGELKKFLMPPSGTAALVEFIEPSEARKAFRRLAYSKFKHIPLYLEWAPEKVFTSQDGNQPNNGNKPNLLAIDGNVMNPLKTNSDKTNLITNEASEPPASLNAEKHLEIATSEMSLDGYSEPVEGSVIFVKNLNFSTDNKSLQKHFAGCGQIVSATVAEKKDPKKPGMKLSMGYGFVTFVSKEGADKALKSLQLSTLDGHKVELKRSNRTVAAKPEHVRKATNASAKPSAKILVRNIPFQATKKEIDQLFKTFGDIKDLRLPKKMVGSGTHRGFCFVEFQTATEAKLAFKALSQSTHLYGRRLVLEWAATDDDTVDVIREKTAQKFKYFNSIDTTKKKKNISIEEIVEQ